MCTSACLPGFVTCSSGVPCGTELAFNDANCGACGHACDTATRCVGGVCVSSEARPIAPLSTSILGGRRPRLRWQRAVGVDGVRLQLCADRACSRVESTQDLSVDEFRPTVALSPGVHFWRLFARRGTVVASNPSPVWEFVLPAVDGSRGIVDYVRDVDGDGVADAITTTYGSGQWVLTVVPSSSPSTPQIRRGISSVVRSIYGSVDRDTLLVDFGCAGDLDGDGFGDLVGGTSYSTFDELNPPQQLASFMFLRGGALTIASDPASEPVPYRDASGVHWSTPGDFDGDGYGDLIMWRSYPSRRSARTLWVRFGSPWPTSHGLELPNTSPTPGQVVVGDFDGNGVTDLAVLRVNLSSGGDAGTVVYRYLGPDRGHPEVVGIPRCADNPTMGFYFVHGLSVVDANADGYDDLRLHIAYASLTFLGSSGGVTANCIYSAEP